MKLKKGDQIEIIWRDSCYQDAGWKTQKSVINGKPAVISSTCKFLKETKHWLYTIGDRCKGDDGVMRDLRIPKACIEKIHKLRRCEDAEC